MTNITLSETFNNLFENWKERSFADFNQPIYLHKYKIIKSNHVLEPRKGETSRHANITVDEIKEIFMKAFKNNLESLSGIIHIIFKDKTGSWNDIIIQKKSKAIIIITMIIDHRNSSSSYSKTNIEDKEIILEKFKNYTFLILEETTTADLAPIEGKLFKNVSRRPKKKFSNAVIDVKESCKKVSRRPKSKKQ